MTDGTGRLALDGLPPIGDMLRQHDLLAKKSLGQNFILDLNLTRRIAHAAGDPAGWRVIEVGPGPGGLTRALLLEGAREVIAIERDQRCLGLLAEVAHHYPGKLHIVEGDALETDYPGLLVSNDAPAMIAANLPYNIATRLLVGWLEAEPWPPWWQRMALMFQKEVADRITASPGSKAYGRLAVISQWRCKVRTAMVLKPDAFTPPPKVSSAVVVFEPRREPAPACNVRMLAKITAAAFGQRRKMLRQSLRTLGGDPGPLLAAAGIADDRRPEQLSVQDFARLAYVAERLANS